MAKPAWTILSINPSKKEVTMQSAAGKVLVVPMGSEPKDLEQQKQVMAEAQKKHQKRELIKKLALGAVVLILVVIAIVRR